MTAKEGGATEEYIDVAVDLDSATRLSGHIGPVTGVGFFHKGTKLLSAGVDKDMRIWDIQPRVRWAGILMRHHEMPITFLRVSKNQQYHASVDQGGTMILGAFSVSQIGGKLSHHFSDRVVGLEFCPGGDCLVVASERGEIAFWKNPQGKDFQSWQRTLSSPPATMRFPNMASIDSLSFSEDGRGLFLAGDGAIGLWEFGKKNFLRFDSPHKGKVTALALSPDGNTLASGGGDSDLILYKIERSLKIMAKLPQGDPIASISFSPNGKYLAVAAGPMVRMYETFSYSLVSTFIGTRRPVSQIAFNPDSSLLAAAGLDHSIRLYPIASPDSGISVLPSGGGTYDQMGSNKDDVDEQPKSTNQADTNSFAVVIAVQEYQLETIPRVAYAARDGQSVFKYLTTAMGFPPANSVLLLNDQATLSQIKKFLGPWLAMRAKKGGKVFIYFAGHGTADPKSGEGRLLPYDGDPNHMDLTAVNVREVVEGLGRLEAQVSLVLDSCFAGRGARSISIPGARPLVWVQGTAAGRDSNTVILGAAEGDQISTFYPPGRHGLFTHFFLKGLRGSADADKDGNVEVAELFRYLRPAVEAAAREQNIKQTPFISPEIEAVERKNLPPWIRLKE